MKTKEKVNIVLPSPNTDNKQVIKYLTKKRCIDPELIAGLIKEGYLYQDTKGNCVFVGFTDNKEVGHISLRAANVKSKRRIDVPGSDKSYSFSLQGTSETVNVFESTIDLLSFITMFRNEPGIGKDGFVSLGGMGRQALRRYLANNSSVKCIRVCTDNDEAGERAAKMISKEFSKKYRILRLRPHHKDFNEDLCCGLKHGRIRKHVTEVQ